MPYTLCAMVTVASTEQEFCCPLSLWKSPDKGTLFVEVGVAGSHHLCLKNGSLLTLLVAFGICLGQTFPTAASSLKSRHKLDIPSPKLFGGFLFVTKVKYGGLEEAEETVQNDFFQTLSLDPLI